jgi:hypothetical protein
MSSISFVLPEELTDEEYSTVGIIFATISDEALPEDFSIDAYVLEDGSVLHEVTLLRDLTAEEARDVYEAWVAEFPDDEDDILEFSVEAKPEEDLEEYDEVSLCEGYAGHFNGSRVREQHKIWYNTMVNEGWRYGQSLNERSKTSPSIQSWEKLPASLREEYELFEGIFDRQWWQTMADLVTSKLTKEEYEAAAKILHSMTLKAREEVKGQNMPVPSPMFVATKLIHKLPAQFNIQKLYTTYAELYPNDL